MTDITIPFRDDMKQAILEGRKSATTRNKRYGKRGDTFTLDGQKFVLKYIHRMPLGVVARNLWMEEGCPSEEQFIKIWKQIHPRKGFVKHQMVFVHEFVKVIE